VGTRHKLAAAAAALCLGSILAACVPPPPPPGGGAAGAGVGGGLGWPTLIPGGRGGWGVLGLVPGRNHWTLPFTL